MKLQKIYSEIVEEEALKQFNSALALECVVAAELKDKWYAKHNTSNL